MTPTICVKFLRSQTLRDEAFVAGQMLDSRGVVVVDPSSPLWADFAKLYVTEHTACSLVDGVYPRRAIHCDEPQGSGVWRKPRLDHTAHPTAPHEWDHDPSEAELLAACLSQRAVKADALANAQRQVAAAMPLWEAWCDVRIADLRTELDALLRSEPDLPKWRLERVRVAFDARDVSAAREHVKCLCEAAEDNVRSRKKAAEAASALEAAVAWARQHGSARLRRIVDEGMMAVSLAVYRDERLMAERPDWQWSAEADGEYDNPRNPTNEAFLVLDSARKDDPTARLVSWAVEVRDEGGDEATVRRWAAVSMFLGREIVTFGD